MTESLPKTIAMRPNWRDLLFLHWEFSPNDVQKLLPEGLEVDTFNGRAYVGLVPFRMEKVRPSFVPNMGRFGHWYEDFAELNVRTYVKRNGVSGVWFFSLDAASTPAVITARVWFGLPYFRARMRFWRGRDGAYRYLSHRLWPGPTPADCSVRYRFEDESSPAPAGSLEEFLVERYVLFSQKGRGWYAGRVYHEPYLIQEADVEFVRESCLAAAGFSRPSQVPHALYSRGVEVVVGPLEEC